MAYFPEYYGGEYWSRAINQVGAELGSGIASSLQFYRQRHDELTQMDATFDQLRQMADSTGKPVLDAKAYERIKAHTDKERYGLEKGYLEALSIGSQLQKAHSDLQKTAAETDYYTARARESPLSGQPIYDETGRLIGHRDEKGAPHYFTHETVKPEEEQPAGTSPSGVRPGEVVQKESPWWQRKTNELVKSIYGGMYTGPFKLQQEIRRAIPVGPSQQAQGQPGRSLPPLESNPDANRIRALYAAKKISKEEAARMIRALGYTDVPM